MKTKSEENEDTARSPGEPGITGYKRTHNSKKEKKNAAGFFIRTNGPRENKENEMEKVATRHEGGGGGEGSALQSRLRELSSYIIVIGSTMRAGRVNCRASAPRIRGKN